MLGGNLFLRFEKVPSVFVLEPVGFAHPENVARPPTNRDVNILRLDGVAGNNKQVAGLFDEEEIYRFNSAYREMSVATSSAGRSLSSRPPYRTRLSVDHRISERNQVGIVGAFELRLMAVSANGMQDELEFLKALAQQLLTTIPNCNLAISISVESALSFVAPDVFEHLHKSAIFKRVVTIVVKAVYRGTLHQVSLITIPKGLQLNDGYSAFDSTPTITVVAISTWVLAA